MDFEAALHRRPPAAAHAMCHLTPAIYTSLCSKRAPAKIREAFQLYYIPDTDNQAISALPCSKTYLIMLHAPMDTYFIQYFRATISTTHCHASIKFKPGERCN